MALDDADKEQRTEAPSERKLKQAFDEGDIALSKELASTGALIVAVLTLVALSSLARSTLTRAVEQSILLAPTASFSTLGAVLFPMALPVAAAIAAAGLAGVTLSLVQTRGGLWSEKAMPDLSRVFSTERLTRLFSRELLVDLSLSIVKVVAIVAAVWGVVRAEFLTLGRLGHSGPAEQLAGLFGGLLKITVPALGLLVAFAGVDFALTRWRYRKRHMMTKDELKREMKEDEGDPLLRGARKRRHREIIKRNAVNDTRTADALVVNPTHVAVAIRYRREESAAPRVVAKGKGALAEKMREAARASGVPIIQDVPLARLLFKKVKVGGQVPAETYKAVAAVLAIVYRLTGHGGQAARPGADGASP